MANAETFNAAINTLGSSSSLNYSDYWQTYYPSYTPHYNHYYPHYHVVTRDERLKFALELIATGTLTKQQLVQIAKEALNI